MTHISDDVWSVNQKQPRAQFKVVRSLEGALLLWISMLSIYLCCQANIGSGQGQTNSQILISANLRLHFSEKCEGEEQLIPHDYFVRLPQPTRRAE